MPANIQEPTGRMIRQFFLGFVKIHILHHASEEPVCGVDLVQELSSHGYRLSPGTLYPTLHGLQAAGYLKCHLELRSGRRRRIYSITRAGIKALTQARRQIRELTKEVIKEDLD
jgi:PadR family transcriptional regulator PadR